MNPHIFKNIVHWRLQGLFVDKIWPHTLTAVLYDQEREGVDWI